MKKLIFLTVALFTMLLTTAQQQTKEIDFDTFEFAPNLETLRSLSKQIAGDLPLKINVEKIAETIRPADIVVKGEDPTKKMVLARTVYQIEYPNKNIMLDSGMDYKTHKTFGTSEEPYFPDKFKNVQRALEQADLIILTHYHADHVGGIVTSENFDKIAPKVWVSELTANLMLNKPHKKTIQIAKHKVDKFRIAKDSKYTAIAPGVVLFMAPGHTPDSKMVYIKLNNGQEFIHSIDSGWSMENIRQEKIKNASWVTENKEQLLTQYKWLNSLSETNPEIIILCTHDNEQYNNYIKSNILGNGLNIYK